LVPVLASYQEFSDHGRNWWLPEFATLCNYNKHDDLTPHWEHEAQGWRIGKNGIAVVGGENITITDCVVDGTKIEGTHRLDVPHPPFPPESVQGPLDLSRERLVSLRFASAGYHIADFLDAAIEGVARIVADLKSRL
jgi:hypothetical protein